MMLHETPATPVPSPVKSIFFYIACGLTFAALVLGKTTLASANNTTVLIIIMACATAAPIALTVHVLRNRATGSRLLSAGLVFAADIFLFIDAMNRLRA